MDETFSNLTYIKDVTTVVICYLSKSSVTTHSLGHSRSRQS